MAADVVFAGALLLFAVWLDAALLAAVVVMLLAAPAAAVVHGVAGAARALSREVGYRLTGRSRSHWPPLPRGSNAITTPQIHVNTLTRYDVFAYASTCTNNARLCEPHGRKLTMNTITRTLRSGATVDTDVDPTHVPGLAIAPAVVLPATDPDTPRVSTDQWVVLHLPTRAPVTQLCMPRVIAHAVAAQLTSVSWLGDRAELGEEHQAAVRAALAPFWAYVGMTDDELTRKNAASAASTSTSTAEVA